MLSDMLGWGFFIALTLGAVVTSTYAAFQARRSFGVMGTRGPAGYVVWGIGTLAGMLISLVLIIAGQRIMFMADGLVLPLWSRVGIFFALLVAINVGFGLMGVGFKRQADGIVALRRHWFYTQGAHLPAPPLDPGGDTL